MCACVYVCVCAHFLSFMLCFPSVSYNCENFFPRHRFHYTCKRSFLGSLSFFLPFFFFSVSIKALYRPFSHSLRFSDINHLVLLPISFVLFLFCCYCCCCLSNLSLPRCRFRSLFKSIDIIY